MGHHYLPQYYLKGFCPDEKSIWVFDKKKKDPYQTHIKKTANETKLYSEELEFHLSRNIEAPANKVIYKIKNKQVLTNNEKLTLAEYIYTLLKRVPAGKANVAALIPKMSTELNQELSEEIDKLIAEDPKLTDVGLKRKVEIDAILTKQRNNPSNEIWHKIIEAKSLEYVGLLASMKWQFLVQNNSSFLTCDNPIFYFKGMGIYKKTAELSFPISSNIMLWATWRSDIPECYQKASVGVIKEFNRRTAHNCNRFVYSQKNEEWILPFISKSNFKLNRII